MGDEAREVRNLPSMRERRGDVPAVLYQGFGEEREVEVYLGCGDPNCFSHDGLALSYQTGSRKGRPQALSVFDADGVKNHPRGREDFPKSLPLLRQALFVSALLAASEGSSESGD